MVFMITPVMSVLAYEWSVSGLPYREKERGQWSSKSVNVYSLTALQATVAVLWFWPEAWLQICYQRNQSLVPSISLWFVLLSSAFSRSAVHSDSRLQHKSFWAAVANLSLTATFNSVWERQWVPPANLCLCVDFNSERVTRACPCRVLMQNIVEIKP